MAKSPRQQAEITPDADCPPDLAISKSASSALVEPGGTLVYTVTYGNTGGEIATEVTITDILPAGVNYESASLTPTVTFPPPTHTVIWKIEDLDLLGAADDYSIVITVTAQVPLTDRLSLPNRVEIDCKETDPVSDVITTVVASPNLTITKTANTDYVGPGDTLVYTVTYGNTGTGHATDVRITDTLPVGVNDLSARPTPVVTPTAPTNIAVWKIEDLDPLGTADDYSIVITVTAQVPLTDGLSLPNRVEIDCKETDPVSAVITTTVASPNLTITKTANTDYAGPGDTLVYTITYGNTGTGHATDVRITDTLPVGVNYPSASPTPTDLFTTTNALTLVWKFNELHPGGNDFIVITLVTPLMGEPTLTNVVRMDCDQTDPVSDTVTIRVPMIFFPLIVRDFKPFCNGGFETGDFTCWAHGGRLDRSAVRAPVYEGSHAAELGSGRYACRNGVPVGSAWMSQAFTVPPCYDPSRPKPTLSFKYAIFSQDVLKDDKWDSFDVYIEDGDTPILRDGNDEWEEARCDTFWNSEWRSHSEDLSAYKGQNIEVTFRNVSRVDGWFNTWTYVDNVQVTCEGP